MTEPGTIMRHRKLTFALAIAGGLAGTASHAGAATHPRSEHLRTAERPLFAEEGLASWYATGFAGRKTASGERFDPHAMSAAHRTLPFGTVVRVTNLRNGRTVEVRINDRGPAARRSARRILDLSKDAAVALGMTAAGVAKIRIVALASDQRGG